MEEDYWVKDAYMKGVSKPVYQELIFLCHRERGKAMAQGTMQPSFRQGNYSNVGGWGAIWEIGMYGMGLDSDNDRY